jgi:hypothetical protein
VKAIHALTTEIHAHVCAPGAPEVAP